MESSALRYVVYNSEGLLKVKSRLSTVMGAECNDRETRTDILLVVARAIFYKR